MIPLLAASDTDIVIVAIPIVSVLAVVLTALLTHHYRKAQRDDMEATLKMEMIQRGMSAEDIERVLAARLGESSARIDVRARAFTQGAPTGAASRNS